LALNVNDIGGFLKHILQRIDLTRDLHFYTNTTIDTLDYSGSGLNAGSKVVLAATGAVKRELWGELPRDFGLPRPFEKYKMIMPGVLAVEVPKNIKNSDLPIILEILQEHLQDAVLEGLPLMVLCDDAGFTAQNLNNFVWVTFTRSNPSHDIYGINSFTENKHWGCTGPLIIDARIKPHHAPVLEKDPEIEKFVDSLGGKGRALYGII